MKLNRFVASMVFTAALGASSASHALIQSDIVFMVDESGSMSNVQTNLRNNIGTFASILLAGGLDVRFALVGYGNSAVVPHVLTDFTNATNFATAALGLVASGGTEPGYTTTAFSLNAFGGTNLNYRTNAVKNLMIFTDEASNGDTITRGGGTAWTEALVDAQLTANNALFNAITRSGAVASYADLATNHGGQTFDLNGLNTTDQTVVGAFVQAFATAKLKETIDFCTANPTAPECQGSSVPEPGSLALLGLALAGLTGLRRKAIY
ncbi:MAG: hypothetical protein CVU33_06705 [Betaproteobacteria bacterium HGW-Betaproteobacteria-6]|nr:MAG: hypothetical protein CVU33_06705 [Betaproteobacteria bacterium HGW-Betaproteobacteria-6]